MWERLRRALPAVIGLAIFLAALEVLRRELHAVSWHTLSADVRHLPARQLLAALAITALNYTVLTGYDLIAVAGIGRGFSRIRVVAASFVAYAVANNVGFAMLSGASVRYRFYTRWGATAEELSRIVFSYSISFWLGLLLLGGLSLVFGPLPDALGVPAAAGKIAGAVLAAASLGYVVATALRRAPLRIGRVRLPLPPVRLALAQLALSIADWTLAGAVLYVLLPPGPAPFSAVLGAFLAAQLLGLASHVPGGVGVFEGLMVLLLKPYLTSAALLPALVVYRVVYYLVPLAAALVLLVADEVRQRRHAAMRLAEWFGRVSGQLTPSLLSLFTFLAGAVLLFSGATPAAAGRLAFLHRLLIPLPVIETSHILGSVAGAALLLLSQGLARRLDAAFYLATTTLVIGILASLLKGADYEEALLLAALLVLLQTSRPSFDRKAALLETRFSPAWIAAVVAALSASVWLGLFAFKHVEYSSDLFWQFERNGEASRFLRGSVAASAVLFLAALARLLAHAPHEAEVPTEADLADAARIVASQPRTQANLVFLRDKAILFDRTRSAFLMYAVQGRTFVAMGDPIGPPALAPELVRLFLERCTDYGGTPVFYEIRHEQLHQYADFGLTFLKLGEEAIVDLRAFTLEGGAAARLRQSYRRLEKDGATFRVVPAAGVRAILPRLQEISDDWLARRSAAEKGFSLGFFDPAYVSRMPVAVVEQRGAIVAFANLWTTGGTEELSMDLMRYHHDAPRSIMETLIVHLLQWGKEQGYGQFILGMAPMSGFEDSPVAPLWSRLGHFLYEHGESLYSFQGLRAFKEKFNPTWQSRYLAYPGGLRLPRILADVSALIAGGYRRIFLK
jgi:phosphatidylglycerol lysyltransferase